MPNLRKPTKGEKYIIVEGGDENRTGECVHHIETSFGRIWVDLKMDDRKQILRKRMDDVRTESELKDELKAQAR